MAKEAKKKEPEVIAEKSLEQLILERSTGKYLLVPLASQWALALRRREEHRHLTQNEILELSLKQILTGQVKEEEIVAASAELRAEALASEDSKLKKK